MTIVFATTLKPECMAGAEVAARLAAAWQVPLLLVHVSQDPRAEAFVGTTQQAVLAEETAGLAAEVARLHVFGPCVVTPRLLAGDPADAVASVARSVLARLIVTVARDGAQTVLGDTAERAARAGNTPVLTLRDPERWLQWLQGGEPLRVLVGVDFGRASLAAKALARLLKSAAPCEIRYCVVAESDGGPTAASSAELAALADRDGREVSIQVQRGTDIAANLAVVATEMAADVVLVGQRRSSLLAQLWHGSVSRDLLRQSLSASVTVVPGKTARDGIGYRPLTRLVVGVDFSEAAERAVELALAVAGKGGVLHLAHVAKQSDPTRQLAAGQALQEWLAEIEAARPDVTVQVHLLTGEPADALLALARQIHADALAVGSRSHSALHQVLLGSVAARLVEVSPVPVLLAPLVED